MEKDFEIIENELEGMDTGDMDYDDTVNLSVGSMYHSKPVYAVHFHNNKYFSGGEDDKVVAWKDELIWEHSFKDSVVSIKSSEHKVAIASMDGDILVIENKDEIKCLYTLDGPDEIICLFIKKNIVMCGTNDGLVWIWKNDKVLNVLGGHSLPVTQVDLLDNTVVSCSEDGTVITWDPINNTMLTKLNNGPFAHDCAIVSLCLYNGCLTSDVEGKIVMSHNGKVLGSIQHHQDSVECLTFQNNLIISADVSGKLVIWDYNTKVPRTSLFLDIVITCMRVVDKHIYIGAEDGIIRKYDLLTGDLVFEYTGHTKQILCIEITKDHIISGGDDGNAYIFLLNHSAYESLSPMKDE